MYKPNPAAAAKRILQNAKKTRKRCFTYATTTNGKQVISDTFRAVFLNDHLPLDPIPDNLKAIYPDLTRCIPKHAIPVTLDLPHPVDLRIWIRQQDAKQPLYDFGQGLPVVSAQFLLDMLELLPDAVATTQKQNPVNLYTILFETPSGDVGILCPVNPPKYKTRAKTEV